MRMCASIVITQPDSKDETGCVAARPARMAHQNFLPISTADRSMHQKLIQITL